MGEAGAGGREGRLVQDRSPSSEDRQLWVRRPDLGSRLQPAFSGVRGTLGVDAASERRTILKGKFMTHLLDAAGQGDPANRTAFGAPNWAEEALARA